MDQALPKICHTTNPVTGAAVMLKRGESGYYESGYPVDAIPALNAGLRPEQIMAMENGSMFGWETPGANVAHCKATLEAHARLAAAYAAKVESIEAHY